MKTNQFEVIILTMDRPTLAAAIASVVESPLVRRVHIVEHTTVQGLANVSADNKRISLHFIDAKAYPIKAGFDVLRNKACEMVCGDRDKSSLMVAFLDDDDTFAIDTPPESFELDTRKTYNIPVKMGGQTFIRAGIYCPANAKYIYPVHELVRAGEGIEYGYLNDIEYIVGACGDTEEKHDRLWRNLTVIRHHLASDSLDKWYLRRMLFRTQLDLDMIGACANDVAEGIMDFDPADMFRWLGEMSRAGQMDEAELMAMAFRVAINNQSSPCAKVGLGNLMFNQAIKKDNKEIFLSGMKIAHEYYKQSLIMLMGNWVEDDVIFAGTRPTWAKFMVNLTGMVINGKHTRYAYNVKESFTKLDKGLVDWAQGVVDGQAY